MSPHTTPKIKLSDSVWRPTFILYSVSNLQTSTDPDKQAVHSTYNKLKFNFILTSKDEGRNIFFRDIIQIFLLTVYRKFYLEIFHCVEFNHRTEC